MLGTNRCERLSRRAPPPAWYRAPPRAPRWEQPAPNPLASCRRYRELSSFVAAFQCRRCHPERGSPRCDEKRTVVWPSAAISRTLGQRSDRLPDVGCSLYPISMVNSMLEYVYAWVL